MKRSSVLSAMAWVSALVLIAASALLQAQGTPPGAVPASSGPASAPASMPAKATLADVDKAIADLSSDNFKTREKATQRLWELGPIARAALMKAAKNSDPEVSARAASVLDKFSLGVYPDTPKDVIDLAQKYRDAEAPNIEDSDTPDRAKIIDQMIAIGPKAYRTVATLAMRESSWQVLMGGEFGNAKFIFLTLHKEITQDVPTLIAKGDLDGARNLLEKGAACGYDPAIRSYAAFLLSLGKLDQKIKALADSPDPMDRRMLAYFYRARGDLPKALASAKESEDELLAIALAGEAGQWKDMTQAVLDQPGQLPATKRFLLSCYRLAGQRKEFDALAKDIADYRGKDEAYIHFKALALNELPDEAMAFLHENELYSQEFDLLSMQMKYNKAFDLLEKVSKDDLPEMQLTKARILYLELGQKDQAQKYLEKMFERNIQDADQRGLCAEIIDTEGRLEIKTQAMQHAVDLMSLTDANAQALLRVAAGSVFPKQRSEAVVWAQILMKEYPNDTPKSRLDRLAAILEGKTPAKEVLDLVRRNIQITDDSGRLTPVQMRLGLADTCQRLSDLDLAVQCLEAPAGSDTEMSILNLIAAEYLRKAKKWKEAAAKYGAFAKAQPYRAVGYYFQGYALAQAGQKEEGKKLMDQANLMALADDEARMDLARALGDLEQPDQVRAQRQWLIRAGEVFGLNRARACMQEALSAKARKDFAAEVNLIEQYRLELALPHIVVNTESVYARTMRDVHLAKMQLAVAAGNLDQALAEGQLAGKAMPQDPDVAINLWAPLIKAGKKEQAQKLYDDVWNYYEAILKENPLAPSLLNSQAWLAARCRTNLDEALKLAKRAVSLRPDTTAFMDTLAEVQFQLGHTKEAIELMKQCLDLEVKTPSRQGTYYKTQLKRFEAGDPSVDPQEDTAQEED